mmetsp:Transcript_2171/g.3991  ORF Transcript_2171/g.3991 Transcript_2171/m.3991 type:complete len:934 (-) Transcript_2171:103-2904(-)
MSNNNDNNTLNTCTIGCDCTIEEDDRNKASSSYTDNQDLPYNFSFSSANMNYHKDATTANTSNGGAGTVAPIATPGRGTTLVPPGRASPDIFSWWLPEDDVSPEDRLLENFEPLNYDQDPDRFAAVPPSKSDIQLLRIPVVSTEGSVAVGSSSHLLSSHNLEDRDGNTDAYANCTTTRSFYERQRQQAAGAATTASNPSTVCINQAIDYLERLNGRIAQQDCAEDMAAIASLNSGVLHSGASSGVHAAVSPFARDDAFHANTPTNGSCIDDCQSLEHSNDMEYFHKMVSSLSMFQQKYGHTNVPKIASWFLLGSWVEQMRRRKKVQSLRERGIKVAKNLAPLSPEQTSILDAMGFKWQAPDFYENEMIIKQIKAQEAQQPCSLNSPIHSPCSEETASVRVGNDSSLTGTPPQDEFRCSTFDHEGAMPTPIPYDPAHENNFRMQSQQQLDMGMFERLSLPDMAANGSNHSAQNVDCPIAAGVNHGFENYFQSGYSQFHHELPGGQSMSQKVSAPNSYPGHISHFQNLSLNSDAPVSRFAHDFMLQGQQPSGFQHFGYSTCSQGSRTIPAFHSVNSSSHQLPFGQHPNQLSMYNNSESCSWNHSAYNYSAANGNPFDIYSCHQSLHSHPLPSTCSDNFNGYQTRPRILSPTEVYSSHCSSRSFTAPSVRSHCNQSCDGKTSSCLSFTAHRYDDQFEAVEALRKQMIQNINEKSKVKFEAARGKKRKSPVNDADLERETACSTLSRMSRASREENSEQIWQYQFSKLKEYFDEKGNCDVPARYDDDAKLGHWVMTQRRQYHLMKSGKRSRITQARIDQLNTLNFKWAIRKENKVQWDERYNELVEFKKANGHCLVPQRYPSNPSLGTWVNTQRRHYKLLQDGRRSCLTEDRLKKLNEIGFVWSTQSSSAHEIDQDLDIARFHSFIRGDEVLLQDAV